MKLHNYEYIFEPDGLNLGQCCWRLAVPGGWVYVFGQLGHDDKRGRFEDVQGTCFVPDPYAFHVKGKGKGKGKSQPRVELDF